MAEKKRRWWLWILVAVSLLGVLAVASTAAILVPVLGSQKVAQGTILELKLDGAMSDAPVTDPLAELGIGGGAATSFWDIRTALRRASGDDDIAGLLVTVHNPAMAMGHYEELAAEIERFSENKPVHALIRTDMVGDGNYYVATAADHVWATPVAFWVVNGFNADVTFWRGTLDKLHVTPHYIMVKEYKSAGEPLSRYEMSEYFRESITAVVEDMETTWYADVARRRGLEIPAVQGVVARGMMTSADAKAAGFIDDVGYVDDVEDALVAATGAEEYEGISVGEYLKRSKDKTRGDTVAVVFGEGPVVSAAGSDNPFAGQDDLFGPKVAEAIRDATEDDAVKAIVFRVNSPGGSAVGSDLVWHAIEEAQEAGKPVVVSMSAVAGSGGYWVAMGADAIVAEPTTITGSIGVVFGKLDIRGFLEWIGANVESLTFAENADLLSPYSGLDEADRERVEAVMLALYGDFKQKVADGRGLDVERVEEIARGRIWSGRDAKDLGLVDELGGFDVAIRLAAEKASLDPEAVRLVLYPEPKSFLEQLLDEDLMSTGTPTLEDFEAFAQSMAAPQPWAWMPEITVR